MTAASPALVTSVVERRLPVRLVPSDAIAEGL
jgi:hypothetical protein